MESLRHRMIWRTLVVGLVADLLAMVIFILDPNTVLTTALLVGSPGLPLSLALVLHRKGFPEVAGWVGALTSVAISVVVVSAFWGLQHSAIFLVVGIVASGLFTGPRGSAVATVASLVYVAFEYTYQVSPWLIDRGPMHYERALDVSVAVLVVGLLSGVGVQRIQRLLEDQEREEAFREALLRSNPTPTLVVDPEGQILEVNQALVELSGVPMGDWIDSALDHWLTQGEVADLTTTSEPIPVRVRTSEIDAAGRGSRRIVALTDLRAERETLRRQRKLVHAAEEASQAKTLFLAGMSHELRTPLNAIIGYAELIDEEVDDAETQRDLSHILSSGKHLLALVDQVLDMSRVEAGKMEVQTEAFSLAALIDDVTVSIRPGVDAKGLALEIHGDFAGKVLADRVRTRQVLLNLLSNAVKFAEHRVVLEVVPTDPVRIRVSDDGPGVPDELRPRLFQPFARGNAAQSNTGLGLALSRELAVRMGGRLELGHSSRGALFELTLPRGPAETHAPDGPTLAP